MYWWLVSVPSLSATHENLLISSASKCNIFDFSCCIKVVPTGAVGHFTNLAARPRLLASSSEEESVSLSPSVLESESTARASLGLSATEMTPAAPSGATCPAISQSSILQASLNLPDLDASGQNLFCLIDSSTFSNSRSGPAKPSLL